MRLFVNLFQIQVDLFAINRWGHLIMIFAILFFNALYLFNLLLNFIFNIVLPVIAFNVIIIFRIIADLVVYRVSFIETWIMHWLLIILFSTSITFSKHTIKTFAVMTLCALAYACLTVVVFIMIETLEIFHVRWHLIVIIFLNFLFIFWKF